MLRKILIDEQNLETKFHHYFLKFLKENTFLVNIQNEKRSFPERTNYGFGLAQKSVYKDYNFDIYRICCCSYICRNIMYYTFLLKCILYLSVEL